MKSLCHHTLFLFIVILMVSACSQFDDEGSFDIGDQTYQLAIPLVNTSATIKYLAENATGNVSLKVDQTGKATLFYNGEVLRPVSYTHLRAHETVLDIVCRLLLEKKT